MKLWMPEAVRLPGPVWKIGYPSLNGRYDQHGVRTTHGLKRGEVDHSAEGYMGYIRDYMKGRVDQDRRASWHFTIDYNTIYQHYPIDAHCWHAGDVDDDGGVAANIDLIGKEHVGVAGQPLIEWQLAA